MSAPDTKNIRALLEQATPGPWRNPYGSNAIAALAGMVAWCETNVRGPDDAMERSEVRDG